MTAFLALLLAQAPLPPNHPPTPSAEALVKKLDETQGLKDRDKPFEIAASLGRLYFGQGRFADAKTYYAQAVAVAEPVRALYLQEKKALGNRPVPPPADAGCKPGPESTQVVVLDKARAHVKAGKHADAVACLKLGMQGLMESETMLGHARFLLGDADGALATYTRALETFEGNVEARYARAALLLDAKGDDAKALAQAKADFERFLSDAPTAPQAPQAKRLLDQTTKAIAAGGLSKVAPQVAVAPPEPARQPGMPPVLSKETMEAFQNAPRTPEMEANFAKLVEDAEEHLARGRFQEALGNYRQVMPFQPDNPRLRAGMAWTMVKLNRQPMADNVWRVATENPDAVAALGDRLKAKGDAEGAKALWQRLKDTVPSYAPRLDGKL
ncbi:MAG: tetratricopeptide repeat protein [Myxococcota bacterium]